MYKPLLIALVETVMLFFPLTNSAFIVLITFPEISVIVTKADVFFTDFKDKTTSELAFAGFG